MPRIVPGRAKKLAVHVGGHDVGDMLSRQNWTGMPASVHELDLAAIGCLGGELLVRDGDVLVLTGTPINGPDFARIDSADAAARLLPECDGAFAAVFWDAQRQLLVAVTDCLGFQPLYMQQRGDGLRLASETKAIGKQPDLAAWGAFISIGHPIADRSLAEGVRRVPPASVVVYDYKSKALTASRYWDWPEPSDAWRDYDFAGALEHEIKAYADLLEPGTLLLSGGFDSRLLLLLLERARVPVDALIVAHDDELDDADGRLAEQAARMAAVGCHTVHPPHDFFSSLDYLEHLAGSDVGYPSLNLFIAKVAAQIESSVVWDGLVPGFMLNASHLPEGGFTVYMAHEVEGRESAAWRAARTVFKPDVVEAMFEGFAADWRGELARLPDNDHGVARFIVENRARNRASTNPHKVYANRATALTPGLSKEFINHAATIPLEYRKNARFYRDLLARVDQRLLQIPIVSGGTLFKGARFSPAYYRERARMEINKYRLLYPRLFDRKRRIASAAKAERSTFLGDHLLDPDDESLNPGLKERLRGEDDTTELAWQLLFHWRAWHWLHEGQLFSKLNG